MHSTIVLIHGYLLIAQNLKSTLIGCLYRIPYSSYVDDSAIEF